MLLNWREAGRDFVANSRVVKGAPGIRRVYPRYTVKWCSFTGAWTAQVGDRYLKRMGKPTFPTAREACRACERVEARVKEVRGR